MAGTLTRPERGSLSTWDRGPLARFREEMDQMFHNFFSGEMQPGAAGRLPSIDVSETDDAVEIKTDVPGFQADEIDIDLSDGGVTISGKHSEEKESDEDDGRKFHHVERRTGSFSRFVRLPCGVEESKVDAQLKDGVLSLTLPKSEKDKHRKVKVKG